MSDENWFDIPPEAMEKLTIKSERLSRAKKVELIPVSESEVKVRLTIDPKDIDIYLEPEE